MNYKLKHLSKYCCKPANELEFEAVKMAAEIGGVEFDYALVLGYHYFVTSEGWGIGSKDSPAVSNRSIITVLDFCNKLRMTEEEAEKLEDDRVKSCWTTPNYVHWNSDNSNLVANKGYHFKTNADKTKVTLHKR